MKRLQSAKTDQVELEVIECDCGFHIGIDVSYLLQCGDVKATCPSCQKEIDTAILCPEVAQELDNHTYMNEEEAVDHIEDVLRASPPEQILIIFKEVVNSEAELLEGSNIFKVPFVQGSLLRTQKALKNYIDKKLKENSDG